MALPLTTYHPLKSVDVNFIKQHFSNVVLGFIYNLFPKLFRRNSLSKVSIEPFQRFMGFGAKPHKYLTFHLLQSADMLSSSPIDAIITTSDVPP